MQVKYILTLKAKTGLLLEQAVRTDWTERSAHVHSTGGCMVWPIALQAHYIAVSYSMHCCTVYTIAAKCLGLEKKLFQI